MHPLAESVTGVPIEWLFGTIATLVGLLYFSLLYEIRRLRARGERRDSCLQRVKMMMFIVCKHLGIDVPEDDTSGD